MQQLEHLHIQVRSHQRGLARLAAKGFDLRVCLYNYGLLMNRSDKIHAIVENLRLALSPVIKLPAFGAGFFRPRLVLEQPQRNYSASTVYQFHGGHILYTSRKPSQPNSKLNLANYGPKRNRNDKAEIPRDENIKAYKVQIIQNNNTIGEPVLLVDALNARAQDERGRLTQFLRPVREPDEQFHYPLCRYYDKQLERDRESTRKKASRSSKTGKKQLEINWTVGDNDLNHRMGKLKEFLGKGWQVEVIIGSTRKRGWSRKRTDNKDMAERLVANIRNAAFEVEGAKQKAEMRGNLGEEVSLSFEGSKKHMASTC